MNKDATQLAQKAIAKKLVEKPKLEAKSKSEGELARRSSSETKEDNYMKAAVALSGVIAAIAGVASAPVAAGIAVGKFSYLVPRRSHILAIVIPHSHLQVKPAQTEPGLWLRRLMTSRDVMKLKNV